jgi:hypothetical protein
MISPLFSIKVGNIRWQIIHPYALPKYNDQGWKPINANLDVHNDLPVDAKTGIGWMRLKFFAAEKIRGKQLAL